MKKCKHEWVGAGKVKIGQPMFCANCFLPAKRVRRDAVELLSVEAPTQVLTMVDRGTGDSLHIKLTIRKRETRLMQGRRMYAIWYPWMDDEVTSERFLSWLTDYIEYAAEAARDNGVELQEFSIGVDSRYQHVVRQCNQHHYGSWVVTWGPSYERSVQETISTLSRGSDLGGQIAGS